MEKEIQTQTPIIDFFFFFFCVFPECKIYPGNVCLLLNHLGTCDTFISHCLWMQPIPMLSPKALIVYALGLWETSYSFAEIFVCEASWQRLPMPSWSSAFCKREPRVILFGIGLFHTSCIYTSWAYSSTYNTVLLSECSAILTGCRDKNAGFVVPNSVTDFFCCFEQNVQCIWYSFLEV